MNFNIIYIIPSYKRPKLLRDTTIKLLLKHNIKEATIFVSEEELFEYSELLCDLNIKINMETTKEIGIGNVRNYIRNFYPSGSNLLMIDDDIEDILEKNETTGKLESMIDIKKFNEKMFKIAIEKDIYIWGVQLHDNPYFMKKELVLGLNYINGSWTGHRIDKSKKEIKTDIDHFEDYLFSIKHFIRDRNVMKAGKVSLKTKCFNGNGGICSQVGGFDKRKDHAFLNGHLLKSHFGKLLYLTKAKKYDNVVNIRFKCINWNESYNKLLENYQNHLNLIIKYKKN